MQNKTILEDINTRSFPVRSLSSLSKGDSGTVYDVPENRLLASLGVRIGKHVRVLSKSFANGPLILLVGSRSIVVDRKLAEKIEIRK